MKTSTQSVLFDKRLWSQTAARAWLKEHGYSSRYYRSGFKERFHRFRQVSPDLFVAHTIRSIKLGSNGSGITALIGKRRNPGQATRPAVSSVAYENPKPHKRRKPTRHNIPQYLAELGTVLVVELTDGSIQDYRTKWRFCATETGKTIWLIKTSRSTRLSGSAGKMIEKQNKVYSQAKRLYERFSDWQARYTSKAKIDTDGQLRLIGRVKSLAYESDKWEGRETAYVHDFKRPPSIWTDGKRVMKITGPSLRITARGIEG